MITSSDSNFNKNLLTIYFKHLKDPRRTYKGNLKHSLSDILLLTLSAVVCGCQEWDSILLFAEQELDWLKKHGSFSKGLPSKDTLRRFFSVLDPDSFNSCYRKWIDSLRNKTPSEVIAIDGKTIRGAKSALNNNIITPHILSAFATDQELCLGQLKVLEKSNEITAIPELLDLLFVQGSTVTIDAMGCQKTIVEKIRCKKANYVIAVKANQGALHMALKDTLLLEKPVEISVEDDCGHGRVEKRTCKIYNDLSHFSDVHKWRDLKTFVIIEKEVFEKSSQKTSIETRYYISNLKNGAKNINEIVRKHWAVENQLHWVLDVVLNEDNSRKRTLNCAENFNIILKSALTLINQEKTLKKSKNNKRLKALLNQEYREKVFNF